MREHQPAFLVPLVGIIIISIGFGCRPSAGPEASILDDITESSGLDMVYVNGMTGRLFLPEIMGPGVALFDADGDGDLDLFNTQGGTIDPEIPLADTLMPPPSGQPLTDRLFRNDLVSDGSGGLVPRFTDVTELSGIDGEEYGMGAAVGDIDNDGDDDLYVTNFGRNHLWVNRGDGTFADTASDAGVDDFRWSTSASFVDFDRDGWLDLYVANYVDFRVAAAKDCLGPSGIPDYCSPKAYDPVPDSLYRNNGNGTFTDVSAASGVASRRANGLGVVSADFNGDGWIDLYVANDMMRNFLWINNGDGTFSDRALEFGCAVDISGSGQSSMGLDAGDIDDDGDEDLFVAHMVNQTSTLYRNDGAVGFTDITITSGIAGLSRDATTYGTAFVDIDNDGALDLACANGAMVVVDEQLAAGEPYPLREENQIYFGAGDGTFREDPEVTEKFRRYDVSRGLSVGDLDNDGDVDFIIGNSNDPTRVVLNRLGDESGWIGLTLLSEHGRTDIGARAETLTRSGRKLWRHCRTDGSYGSARDSRVLVGLGSEHEPVDIHVVWSDTSHECWNDLETSRYHTLVQSTGAPCP